MEVDFYDKNAQVLFERYQSLDSERIHAAWLMHLPAKPGLALDIGGGSGRDATWLASKGWEVIVIEPSNALRELGQAASNSQSIIWLDDSLPRLSTLERYQHKFSLILVSAVLMHLPTQQRLEAFDSLIPLLADNSLLVITLRQGPSSDEREYYLVPPEEISQYASANNLAAEILESTEDQLQRDEVTWQTVIVQNSVNS